jgi:hypothetical protein
MDRDEADRLYYDNFALISQLCAAAARGLTPLDADEFDMYVKTKLCEDDFRRIRSYEGRNGASVKTFLTMVISRLSLDFRDRLWGRFRPTEGAKRKGPHAILLERLLNDHHSWDDAFEMMRTDHGIALSRREFDELARHVNVRLRPRLDRNATPDAVDPAPSPEQSATLVQMLERYCALLRQLRQICKTLEPEDALILKYRFEDDRRAGDIEDLLGYRRGRVRGKSVFRRIEHLAERLRRGLEATGFSAADVRMFLEHPGLGDGCDEQPAGENA